MHLKQVVRRALQFKVQKPKDAKKKRNTTLGGDGAFPRVPRGHARKGTRDKKKPTKKRNIFLIFLVYDVLKKDRKKQKKKEKTLAMAPFQRFRAFTSFPGGTTPRYPPRSDSAWFFAEKKEKKTEYSFCLMYTPIPGKV